MSTANVDPVLSLRCVGLVRDDRRLLADVDWEVGSGQHWAVLGRNGAGKTSLVRIASLWLHPTTGSVAVAGRSLGDVDVRSLRARVGFASSALSDALRPQLSATEVVMTGRHGALEPWWHHYDDDDRDRARMLLDDLGAASLADRALGTLSSGERQRVALARTLAGDPALVLLDEPTAGLDLAGREELVASLEALAGSDAAPATVLVSHHLEEVPATTTHALLLADGRVCARGPADEVLASEPLSACFGLDLEVERHHGRWSAQLVRSGALSPRWRPRPGP